ncbi:MAG: hypothetical protein K5917_00620 [Clostridiales bacterium]|nr:hypothetical protein [Clostridiales bacterium]
MKRYFYMTIHFSPKYDNQFIAFKDDLYLHKKTNQLYKKRSLYDWGWGCEDGYEIYPPLSFEELINIVISYKKTFFNYYNNYSDFVGAISVIMQDYVEEFIDFLTEKVDTDYFSNQSIRENFKPFSFSSEKVMEKPFCVPGGIGTKSYEEILNQYPKWREIAPKIISQVYGDD